MNDLISRQAAIAEAYDVVIDGSVFKVVQIETLYGLPTIDPVKHGKIIESEETNSGGLIRMVCSECGKMIYCTYGYRLADVRFCPYCGARLDL